MRYNPSDKTEIIRLVEQSPWPARRTLERLGVPRSSFYRWYDRHRRGGPEGLADRPSRPDRVWNRIPEAICSQIVDLALDQPELSPRELAVRFTDKKQYFVSEASVYRRTRAQAPAYESRLRGSRWRSTLGWLDSESRREPPRNRDEPRRT